MATIKDIARISGYSIGTVSRVINNRSDVSPEARQKIEYVIKEQNFQPNTNAKRLKQTTSSDVAVIIRGKSNIFLEKILEQIQISMRSHGEDISVLFIDETDNAVENAVQMVQQNRPKGFIFLGGSLHNFRSGFSRIAVPCVLVTGNAAGLEFENLSSYSTDDRLAAACAVEELIRCGHRRIGIIGGYPDSFPEDNVALRITGAEEVLREKGIKYNRDQDLAYCPFSMQDGYDAVNTLLERSPDITAVFAVSDMVAIGAKRALIDRGLRIPEDISLIGFDGLDITQFAVPRLATIRQDVRQMAGMTVDDLLFRISYKREGEHKKIPFELIRAESIASPRKQ